MLTAHTYNVAGLKLVLLLPQEFDAGKGLPNFKDFVLGEDAKSAEAALTLKWVEALTLPEDARLLFTEDSDMGRTSYFSCGRESWFSLDFVGCKALMRVSEDYRQAIFSIDPAAPTSGVLISSLMRALFAQIVLLHDGISIHASCVIRDGRAYMFLGKSGTGKSTHSRLWLSAFPGSELLNDDNPAVRIFPDGPRVFGTPWSGKLKCWRNVSAPLAGIVRLRQAPFNSFKLLDELQAFSQVYPGCSVLRTDSFLHDRMCDHLSVLCSSLKVGMMDCLPNIEAAHMCAAGLLEGVLGIIR